MMITTVVIGAGGAVQTATARRDIPHNEMRASNVESATTVTLLRAYARTRRGKYQKMWNAYTGKKEKFIFDVPTGDGTESGELAALHEYIQAHVRRMESLLGDIRRDAEANRRWNKVTRGGGRLAKQIANTEAAMVHEIERRKCEPVPLTQAHAPSLPSQPVSVPVLYPKEYVTQVARIEREMEDEENEQKKPTLNECRLEARVRAYERQDHDAVAILDRAIERRRKSNIAKRRRKKERKANLRASIVEQYGRDGTGLKDPNSDNENS